MKILHIIARYNVGGTATWISNLSESLRDKGHESLVLSGNVQPGEEEDYRFRQMGGIRLNELGRRIAIYSDLKALILIRRALLEIQPDVINTHTAKAGVIGRLAAYSLGSRRPAITHTIHGHLFRGYFGKVGTWFVIFIERILSRITDVMLFAGQRVRLDCISRGVIHQKASFVVMPGVTLKVSRKKEHKQLSVGWLARFAPVKRPDRVIEIATRFPDVQFLLGGDGPLRNKLEATAPPNCKFLGWIKPEKFWSQVDIALLTSENEALPISLIEAQLCKLPCISTPAGSASEVVLDGVNGFISTEFKTDELGGLLKLLINDPSLRELMGKRAAVRAKALFSLERQVTDHIDAYKFAVQTRLGLKNG
jgi:glycosyltransferase involved in cell wall biosynthesis